MQHFSQVLSREAAPFLNISSYGSFMHVSTSKGRIIFEQILENTPYTGIYDEFPEEEYGQGLTKM